MKATVIIRTKNEGPIFDKVLQKLKDQTFQDFDIVIVDDNSTDGTDMKAFDYFDKSRVQVINVPKGKFTHPLSCNLGAKISKGEYLVYLNGHSIPVSNTWLEDGLLNFNGKVAGVFAFCLPNPDDNLFMQFIGNLFTRLFHSRKEVYQRTGMGILGTTNAILRKDLWGKYPFNEAFEKGGEDGDWAGHWTVRGYILIQDPKFRAYHSHNWTPVSLVKQYLAWRKMAHPSRIH